MKKIISLFAFAAIVLTFAACGGNDGNVPEVKGFTFEVQTLSTKKHYVITPTNPNAYYIWNGWTYENCHEDEIQSKIEASLASGSFESLTGILKGKSLENTTGVQSPDTKYILYACYVEEDPVTHKGKMVGTPEYVIYKTMPKNTLNGEFSVSATMKVHFMDANMQKRNSSADLTFMTNQWDYLGTTTGWPRDLFQQAQAKDGISNTAPYRMPTALEWRYLFRKRPNAEKLFAHATVHETNGVILLPDNWEEVAPKDIKLSLSINMDMNWIENQQWYKHSKDNFNAYEKNVLTDEQWQTLEFAGAVFLPAAGFGEVDGTTTKAVGTFGVYWSSSSSGEELYFFNFRPDALCPYNIYEDQIYNSIRPVREVTE